MFRSRAKLMSLVVVVFNVFGQLPAVFGQTQNTGAIQGRVFESVSYAALPGATVTITHEDLGLERTTVTDSDGIYYVGILPAGRYRISAARQGYENDLNPQNSVIRNFSIHITNIEKADQPPPIVLRKASAPATPTPTPTPAPVTPPTTTTPPRQPTPPPTRTEDEVALLANTSNATRGGNFDERFLLALPLPGIRNFDILAFLVPGVALPPLHIGTTVGPGIGPGVGTSGQFSVNGLRSRSNNFTIDGSDNNDEDVGVRRQGFTSLVPQSIESVQEFQISTLLPEPQYGRNLAAQVNAVSRSGTSGYHGTIYGFVTDSRWNARDPFEYKASGSRSTVVSNGRTVQLDGAPLTVPNVTADKNPYTRAQYGFVFGGPIKAQKTYFFASVEHQDVNATKTANFSVPTVADRGLFGTGDKGLTVNGVNAFPASLTGNAFISLFPFPNNPAGPYRASTLTQILPASADGTIFSGKLDHNIRAFGKDHSLTGRYNFTDDNTIVPVTGEALFSSLKALVRTQNFALSLNTALSGRAANQFRFSFGRTNLAFKEVRNPFLIPSNALPNVPFLLNAPLLVNASFPGGQPAFFSFGTSTENGVGPIIGLNNTGTGPIGQVRVSGYSPVGTDVFNFPQGRTNNLFQYADTWVLTVGKHRLTAGFDTRGSHLNSFLDRNSRSLAVFSGAVDVFDIGVQLGKRIPELIGGKGGVCVDAACFYIGRDYLAAGAATGFFQSIANGTDSKIRLRYWQNGLFFQDQVRLRTNLTLTIGARYELNTVPTEVDRKIESTFNSPEVKSFESTEKRFSSASGFGAVSGLEQFLGGRTKIYDPDKNNIAPHVAFAWDPFGKGKTSIRWGYGIYFDQILGSVISQSRNVFPRFLTFNLGGFNQFADLNNVNSFLAPHPFIPVNPYNTFVKPGTLNTYKGGDVVIDQLAIAFLTNFASGPGFILPNKRLETPAAQHWSLTIEHQINDFLLSAAYVGTKGSHLLRFNTPNLGPNAIPVVQNVTVNNPVRGFPTLPFPVLNGVSLPPNVAGERLRPFPFLGSFTSIESDADSTYHSLQLQAIKRFSHGVQLTTAYTWSHAIDEVSDIFDLAGATALPQNSLDRKKERGDANFDIRHRFVYSAVWDLPYAEKSKVFGGWQLASIGTLQTGQPYSTLFCCDINLDGNLTDRVEPTVLGSPGNSPRNIYRAPAVVTIDLAANKRFRFTERHTLEFRSEFFNLFNRENFGIPVHQLFFGGYSTEPAAKDSKLFVDTRVPMRTIQFALKFRF